MERTLKNAISKAKRNIIAGRYSKVECLLDVVIGYRLRKDEIRTLVNSINNWLDKTKFEGRFDFESVVSLLNEYAL